MIDDINRDVSAGKGVICDDSLKDGWYRFLLGGSDAVMPTACVPVTSPSAFVPLYILVILNDVRNL